VHALLVKQGQHLVWWGHHHPSRFVCPCISKQQRLLLSLGCLCWVMLPGIGLCWVLQGQLAVGQGFVMLLNGGHRQRLKRLVKPCCRMCQPQH
jgi:hypothetical protein